MWCHVNISLKSKGCINTHVYSWDLQILDPDDGSVNKSDENLVVLDLTLPLHLLYLTLDLVLMLSLLFSIQLCWCCVAVSDQRDQLQPVISRFSITKCVGLVKDFREGSSCVSLLISPQTLFLAPCSSDGNKSFGMSFKMEEWNNFQSNWGLGND